MDLNGNTLLHFLPYGAAETLKFLLQQRVNVNRKNKLGCSPLHLAASAGNLEVLKLLLKSGADVNAQNDLGGTPLYFAMFYKQFAVAEFLKRNGADSTLPGRLELLLTSFWKYISMISRIRLSYLGMQDICRVLLVISYHSLYYTG
jgi:ankyrin repeat protein